MFLSRLPRWDMLGPLSSAIRRSGAIEVPRLSVLAVGGCVAVGVQERGVVERERERGQRGEVAVLAQAGADPDQAGREVRLAAELRQVLEVHLDRRVPGVA